MKNLFPDTTSWSHHLTAMPEARRDFPTSVRPKKPSGRLWLKAFAMTDLDLLWQTIQLDRQSLERADIWPGIDSKEDLEIYISEGHPGRSDSIEFTYLIFDLDGVVLGTFHVHTISWYHRRAELGYWVLESKAGNNFAEEALRLLEPELWKMGFVRLEIRCDPANTKSCGIALQAGYHFEGTLKMDTWTGESFRDTSVFGQLSPLFERARSN